MMLGCLAPVRVIAWLAYHISFICLPSFDPLARSHTALITDSSPEGRWQDERNSKNNQKRKKRKMLLPERPVDKLLGRVFIFR